MCRDSNRDCSFLRISIANEFRTFQRRNRKLLLRKARKRPQGGEPERRKFSLIERETCEESNFRGGSNNSNYSFWWLLTDHNRFSLSAHVLVPPVRWTSAGSFGIPMRNESSLGLLITIAWSEWRWIDSNEQIMTKSWLWRRELHLVTRWIMWLSVRELFASFFSKFWKKKISFDIQVNAVHGSFVCSQMSTAMNIVSQAIRSSC